MLTRVPSRRPSSSPVPARRVPAGSALSVTGEPQGTTPADFEGSLRRAEAFGHHLESLPVQRKPEGERRPHSPGTGTGRPLHAPLRRSIESTLGHDLSSVRVHEGSEAESVGAQAFTQGDHIHFAPGTYSPESSEGRKLLGHELIHVIQQRQGRVRANGQVAGRALNDDPSLEREADRGGEHLARGSARSISLPAGVPMNALRSAPVAAPIQGLGIPDWLKRAGGWAWGQAAGAVGRAGRALGLGGNAQQQGPLPPQDLPDPEDAVPPGLDLAPAPAEAAAAVEDDGGGLGLAEPGPVHAVAAAAVEDDGGGLDLAPASASAASPVAGLSDLVPPSFEELQRQREAAERELRRRNRSSPASAAAAAAGPALSPAVEARIRREARATSQAKAGHGRDPHGIGRERPAGQAARNSARDQKQAEDMAVAQAENRLKKENEKKKP